MKAIANNTRRWTRFKSDPSTLLQIDIKNRRGKFQPTHSALLINESFKGCCGVTAADSAIHVGDVVSIRLGDLEPLEAEIRWVEKLDSEVYKIGFLFLD